MTSARFSKKMEEAKGEPPDGGWGWVICFAAFVGFFISTGNMHSFSVLYVAFLDAFGESKAVTAWIGGIFTLVLTLSSSYGVALAKRFGHRKTVMVAGVLASVGIFTSGFTTSIYQLYFTFGVLSGIGMGLPFVVCFEIVSIYFKKRFPIAIGLAMAGSGAGQFVLSIVTQLMVDRYGWRGMLLIMSAFTSHLCLAGALMRPLKTTQPTQIYESPDKLVQRSKADSGCVNIIHGIKDKDLKLIGDESAESAFMIKVESKTVPQKPNRTRSRRLKSYLLTIYDFTLFKEPLFIIVCIIGIGQIFGTTSTTVHLVRRARDFGISDNMGAYIPAVMGLAQLVGRPSFGALGSIGSFNHCIPYAVTMFVCASSLIISTYTRIFTAQIVLLSIYGICNGGFAVYKTVVLKHFLGNERIGQGMSILLHVQGMAALFIGPLGGWIRDSSGVYDGFYWLSGIWLLLASVLAVSLPVVKRSSTHWCHKGKAEAQNDVTSSKSEKLIIQYTTTV